MTDVIEFPAPSSDRLDELVFAIQQRIVEVEAALDVGFDDYSREQLNEIRARLTRALDDIEWIADLWPARCEYFQGQYRTPPTGPEVS